MNSPRLSNDYGDPPREGAKTWQTAARKPRRILRIGFVPGQSLRGIERDVSCSGEKPLYARKAVPAPTILLLGRGELFAAQTNLMANFNHNLAGGKWDHFMDQPYIGYGAGANPTGKQSGRVAVP